MLICIDCNAEIKGKRRLGRCEHYNGQHISKRGEVVLVAIPRDPTAPFSEAAQLPPSQLIAYCPDCHDAVQRIVKRAVKQMPVQDDGLFAIDEFVVSKASKKQAEVGAA